MTIQIDTLHHHQTQIPTLAKIWYEGLREQWIPGATLGSTQEELTEHTNCDTLPIALIALDQGTPVGLACLRENDGIQPHKAPWLGSLVVQPAYRKQGIGEQLITAIQTLARDLGHHTIHLLAFDPTLPDWYQKLGWHTNGFDELLGHRVTVMHFDLT